MPDEQFSLAFDAAGPGDVGPGGYLRDEIAAAWGLPLGQRVAVTLRTGPGFDVSGILELLTAPDYPWNPRHPLQLRIAGVTFSSRELERWTVV